MGEAENGLQGEVVVLGGTGFLGSRVVSRIRERGGRVAIGTRSPEKTKVSPDGGVRAVRADVRDPESLVRAFDGAFAVVNAVGLYVETRSVTFHDIHATGARNVAETASAQGVRRLVHVSGLNADKESWSSYVHARGLGEEAVRIAFPEATIIRPSALFSEDEGFFATLGPVVRSLPVVPLFGDGGTRLQPVHVGDVAEAVVRSLEQDSARGATFELGGPEVFTYREIVERLAGRSGCRPALLPLPFALWRPIAGAAKLLPSPPLTPAQVALMETDNVAAPDKPGFAKLGITPRSASALGLV